MLNVNAFASLIEKNALGHAYIFFGPPGGGKRLSAHTLARMLEHGAADAPHPLQDALVVRPEGEHIATETIREIKKFLAVAPAASLRRTVIIEDAECITWTAVPALLKIAEEPPPQSLILLIARSLHSLPPALLSRLSRIYFKPATHRPAAAPPPGADEKTPLASRIETAIIKLYLESPVRHAPAISRLLRALEGAARYNLNEKIQMKALAL